MMMTELKDSSEFGDMAREMTKESRWPRFCSGERWVTNERDPTKSEFIDDYAFTESATIFFLGVLFVVSLAFGVACLSISVVLGVAMLASILGLYLTYASLRANAFVHYAQGNVPWRLYNSLQDLSMSGPVQLLLKRLRRIDRLSLAVRHTLAKTHHRSDLLFQFPEAVEEDGKIRVRLSPNLIFHPLENELFLCERPIDVKIEPLALAILVLQSAPGNLV